MLEWPIRHVPMLFPNDAIPGWDFRPPRVRLRWPSTGYSTIFSFVNDLQVQDYASPLNLPRFYPAVEYADSFGEWGDGRTGWRCGSCWVGQRVGSWQRSSRHSMTTMDVFLQFMSSCERVHSGGWSGRVGRGWWRLRSSWTRRRGRGGRLRSGARWSASGIWDSRSITRLCPCLEKQKANMTEKY